MASPAWEHPRPGPEPATYDLVVPDGGPYIAIERIRCGHLALALRSTALATWRTAG